MSSRRHRQRSRWEPPDSVSLAANYLEIPADHVASGIHELPFLNARTLFGRDAPLFLDLVSGRGQHMLREATDNPDNLYVGIDVNTKSLHGACAAAADADLRNVKFICADLRWVLELFAKESVAGAWFLSPAPVPHAQWMKRALVRPHMLRYLTEVLETGATITLRTNVPAASERWRAALLAEPAFEEVAVSLPAVQVWSRRSREGHGFSTLLTAARKRVGAAPRRYSRPFVVLDPMPDSPGWKGPLVNCLQGLGRLPVVHDPAEAAKAHTVLVLSTHLDASVRATLAPVHRKIVNVSGLYAQPFCAPCVAHDLKRDEERAVFAWADIIAVPSQYTRGLIKATYGKGAASKAIVVGAPARIAECVSAAETADRNMRVILLGQRQGSDKHYLLEAELCNLLATEGFTFVRAAVESDPALADFSGYAERYLATPSSGDPARYPQQCAEAGYVLVTSPSETLCLTAIEATAAGCIPVVPDHSAFREWCHPDNRYEPYSIDNIRRILANAPRRDHRIDDFRPEAYLRRLRLLVANATRRVREPEPC